MRHHAVDEAADLRLEILGRKSRRDWSARRDGVEDSSRATAGTQRFDDLPTENRRVTDEKPYEPAKREGDRERGPDDGRERGERWPKATGEGPRKSVGS